MNHSELPLAPYLYDDVSAFAFISSHGQDDSWIAGVFRKAPTGPFSEVWRLKRSFAGWIPRMIVVDNPIRMTAGREIWGLPKTLGDVALRLGHDEHHVTMVTQGLRDHFVVRRLGARTSKSFRGSFELILPAGRTATLKFQPTESAFLASISDGRRGYLFEFVGAAELTAPILLADVA
jgi:hypothetical protein